MSDNVSGLNAIQPTGYFQYDPMIAFDYDDFDMSYNSYPMGMNGSIFDGYNGMGSMMPFAPIGGGNNQSYFDNMKQYQKFYNDYNVDQQKMQRNADMRVNGSMEAIGGSVVNLFDKIKQNEQDQIPKAFEALVENVRSAYGDGTPQELKSRALTLYQQISGAPLIEDLRKYGHSSLIQGIMQSATFSTSYRHSAEDNISDITGQPVGTGEKASQNFGRIVGAVGIGAAAGGITKLITKGSAATASNAKGIMKFFKGGSKAGKIGFLVGGIAAALSFITGKVST